MLSNFLLLNFCIVDQAVTGIEIGEIIIKSAIENVWTIISYSLLITIAAITIIANRMNKHNKYMRWKKTTINFGIVKREFERDDDWLTKELFEENQRLDGEIKKLNNEIKLLKKEYSKLSFSSAIGLTVLLLTMHIKDRFLKNRE